MGTIVHKWCTNLNFSGEMSRDEGACSATSEYGQAATVGRLQTKV